MGLNQSLDASKLPATGDTNPNHSDHRRTEPSVSDVGVSTGNAIPYEIGSFLGKYQIKSFLGRGGMGVVFRGWDPLVERDVALKVMPPELSKTDVALQRFIAEARAVGKLIHPNATALYEIGQYQDTYFLVMEFVSGGALSCLMDQQRLHPHRATRYISEACQGLAAAHLVGLIHRDIKPENLLRNHLDQVKITDFGLAKVSDALTGSSVRTSSPGSLLGTPLYMSPEQYSGGQVDGRTDIYSAGATYFHLLTGRPPYADAKNLIQLMYAHCHKPVPDPRDVVPEVPDSCAKLVMKAMSKQPGDRFATASDMAVAAVSLLDSLRDLGANRPASASVDQISALMSASGRYSMQKRSSLEVWLVEPSRMQAKVLQQHLQALGVQQVRTFSTLAEIGAAAMSEIPNVIISAMYLDDGSGDDLAAYLSRHPRGQSVFCFLVSSDAAVIDQGAYRPGRPMVLPKPLTREILAEVLSRLGGA